MQSSSISNNFVIQLLGRMSAFIIGIVVIGILTRSLGVQGFGEYTTATTFLQLFGVVVDFGLTLTLIVMISESGANKEKVVGNIFAMRMISGTLLFGLAPILVMAFNWSQDIKQGVLVGTIAYILMGGATLLVGIFQHYQSMFRAAIAEIINRVVLLLFVAVFAFMDMGVVWMIGASIFANAAWLFTMIKLAQKYIKVRFYFEWNTWKKIFSRSWPIAVSIFFNLLYLKGDILFLAYFRDQIEVGYYGVAYKVLDVVTALPVMFMGLLLPVMVKAWTGGDKKSFQKYTNGTFNFFMIAVIPIIIGTQAVSEPLIKLIAGAGYQISSDVLKLLIVALIGIFLGALYGHLIVALNKQKQMTWAYAIVAIFSIAGYLWLIPQYGMWGAVYVTLAAEALISTIAFIVVYKVSESRPSLTKTVKAIISATVMYLFLINFHSFNVLLDIAIGATIYIIIMIIIKGIDVQQIKKLIPTKRIT